MAVLKKNTAATIMLVTSTITQNLPTFIPGMSGAVITGMQVMAALTSYKVETNPETRAQYSKFVKDVKDNKEKMIGSKSGMTIIYLPAYIATLVFLVSSFTGVISAEPSLAAVLVNLHFKKRLYEVQCVHKYSGKVGQGTSSFIGLFYALVSLLICNVATPFPDSNSAILGMSLFLTGLAGNYYHHVMLSELRKDSSASAKYVAPKGGLFQYVATPHYFFELLGWLGIAVTAEHGNAYLVFASMTSYLSGRAVSQNQWNKDMFSKEEWPEDRKNLVPFLF